jgi:putative transposase
LHYLLQTSSGEEHKRRIFAHTWSGVQSLNLGFALWMNSYFVSAVGGGHGRSSSSMAKTRRTYKYRLWPKRRQRERLAHTLETCRQLYNDALQERRDAWKTCRQSITFPMQSEQLPACKAIDESLVSVYAQVLQDVLHRVDKTYKAFFRRGYGFPRFKGKGWFDSFTYPQLGFSLAGTQLSLSKIGNVKVKLKGEIKTCTIKHDKGQWYACFSCIVESKPLPPCQDAVGIDVGLESFATTSEGEVIGYPHWFRASQRELRRKQRHVSRCQKRTTVWHKGCREVAQLYKHIFQQRNDFQHKLARELVNRYGIIAVEDLNIKGLAAGMLSKSVLDAAWSEFIRKLAYKAASAGRWLVKVDPRRTSQQCPCGNPVPKKLWHRVHTCRVCGLETTRDHAAALEILRRGLRLVSATPAMVGGLAEASSFRYGA